MAGARWCHQRGFCICKSLGRHTSAAPELDDVMYVAFVDDLGLTHFHRTCKCVGDAVRVLVPVVIADPQGTRLCVCVCVRVRARACAGVFCVWAGGAFWVHWARTDRQPLTRRSWRYLNAWLSGLYINVRARN